MTGEEMERAIGFLLQNQANFDERMTRFEEQARQSRIDFDERMNRAEQEARQSHADFDERMNRLEATQERSQSQLDQLGEKVDHLGNVVAAVNETVQRNSNDILVIARMVDALVEGRNGNGAPKS